MNAGVCVCDLVILKFFCKVLSVRANMRGEPFQEGNSWDPGNSWFSCKL